VTAALRYVWGISHELCAERLHEVLGEYVAILKRDRMWVGSDEATEKLLAMSIGTMKNRLYQFDRVLSGGGRNLTKPSSLKEVIPVRRGPWENPPPGTGEIDTVGHCGNTAEGLFAYTTQYTDICLLWSFLEAQMGKGKVETLESLQSMEKRTPFPWLGLDPDTGSEFINWHCKGWCDKKEIELTRIRPGMKNDHGHIEQKNDKNVRKWAGYIRIDTEERLAVLKELYRTLEVYINHFLPSMKCVKKVRYNISHSSRKYDKAKTPYQRFMEHPDTEKTAKEKMRKFHATLNPKVLHDELMKFRKKLFAGAKFTKSE
ncbi:MAG: transposase, partial [bacterium]|nr:transposase [bacterium]